MLKVQGPCQWNNGDFDAPPGVEVFQPLTPAVLALHQRLKAAFDPAGVLNPGRLYRDL